MIVRPPSGRRRSLVTLAALALVCSAGATGTAADAATRAGATATPAAAATPTARSGAGTMRWGHAVMKGVTSPAVAAAGPQAPQHAPRTMLDPERPLPGVRPNARHLPSATSTRLARTVGSSARLGGPRVLSSFDGVDAIQNLAATGFNTEPPDEGLAAGRGKVVNFVNVTGRVYRQDGTPLTAPFYLNTFFGETPDANTSDPRVYYDADSGRWIASILGYSFNDAGTMISESHVDLAVSDGSGPTGSWHVYRIPASSPQHAGCPCLADYPILGVTRQNVYLSTNEFTGDLNGFNGSQLYVISKSQLVAGAAAPNLVTFEDLAAGGSPGYHVQPAAITGAAPAEYLMSSLDPDGTFDNRLAVWAVTNESAVTTGVGSPALSVRVIGSQAYAVPPPAQTPPGRCTGAACGDGGAPTTGLVETNDDAMQEVQYLHHKLVGALGTGVTIPGDTGPRSGIAWFVVRPAVAGGQVAASTHVQRQGYVSHQGQFLLFPHLNITRNGSLAMVFGLGSPSTYLSSAYATARPGGDFSAIHVVAAGTGPDDGFTGTADFGGVGRWGDYSNGQWIPGTNKVWLATQYIPNSGTAYANWGNSIVGLRLP